MVFHLIRNLNVELFAVGLLKARIQASAGDNNCTAESAEWSMDWVSGSQISTQAGITNEGGFALRQS